MKGESPEPRPAAEAIARRGTRLDFANCERWLFPVATGALIFVPVDFGWHMLLLPGMAVLVWSVVILLLSALRFALGVRPRPWRDVMLPVAALLLWWLGIQAQHYSLEQARAFAMRAAQEVQNRCDADGGCPARIESWVERPEFGSYIKAGWTVKFWLSYRCSEDGKSFEIKVRRNIDFRDLIEGGVRREPRWVARG